MFKKYLVIVDGFKVGVVELTAADVIAMSCDNGIQIMEVE